MNSIDNEKKKMKLAIMKRGFFLMGELLLGLIVLFLSAGTYRYRGAWILGGLYLLCYVIFGLSLPKETMKHRAIKKHNVPLYETIVGLLSWLTGWSVYVIAGLDQRQGWSLPVPWFMLALSIFIFLIGMGIVLWSMIENPFFSTKVEKDEDHPIISTGPYQVIRHPGYLGMMTYLSVVPIILGSLYALIPTLVLLILIYLRMRFEEHFLMHHLKGYIAYQDTVKHRLFRTFK